MISKRAEVHFVERSILTQSAGFLRSTKVQKVGIGGRLSCLARAPRLNPSFPPALRGSLGWGAAGGRVVHVVYARETKNWVGAAPVVDAGLSRRLKRSAAFDDRQSTVREFLIHAQPSGRANF
jgi:hypothetical protein